MPFINKCNFQYIFILMQFLIHIYFDAINKHLHNFLEKFIVFFIKSIQTPKLLIMYKYYIFKLLQNRLKVY